MSHSPCDACETVSHCSRNGCIPLTTEPPRTRAFGDDIASILHARRKALQELAACDAELARRGVACTDGPHGTTWAASPPSLLKGQSA